jgi:hypothetical protein
MMKRTIGWKLAELDRILNDPTATLEADRVWSLLDDVSATFAADGGGLPLSKGPSSARPAAFSAP